jgi:hypothetical protein
MEASSALNDTHTIADILHTVSKLTLNVDPIVVANAKQFAKQRGLSVSGLVETYLAAVSTPETSDKQYPAVLRSLRGILKKGPVQDYGKYLADKYR